MIGHGQRQRGHPPLNDSMKERIPKASLPLKVTAFCQTSIHRSLEGFRSADGISAALAMSSASRTETLLPSIAFSTTDP